MGAATDSCAPFLLISPWCGQYWLKGQIILHTFVVRVYPMIFFFFSIVFRSNFVCEFIVISHQPTKNRTATTKNNSQFWDRVDRMINIFPLSFVVSVCVCGDGEQHFESIVESFCLEHIES